MKVEEEIFEAIDQGNEERAVKIVQSLDAKTLDSLRIGKTRYDRLRVFSFAFKKKAYDLINAIIEKSGLDGERFSSDEHMPPLQIASFYNELEFARQLLDRGANVNYQREDGTAALHCARQPEMVRLLLDAGADVTTTDESNQGPLHGAQDFEVVRLLVEAGADIFAVDTLGQTPIVPLKIGGYDELVEYLRAHAKPLLHKRKGNSLAVRKRKKPYNITSAQGVYDFAYSFREEERWQLLFTKPPAADIASTLKTHVKEVYLDGQKRHLPDVEPALFILEFKGRPWRIVLLTAGWSYLWRDDALHRWSGELGGECIVFSGPYATVLDEGNITESHSWSLESLSDDEIDEDNEARLDAKQKELLKTMDDWFGEKDIFLPPIEVRNDGFSSILSIAGIKKRDVSALHVLELETPEISQEKLEESFNQSFNDAFRKTL